MRPIPICRPADRPRERLTWRAEGPVRVARRVLLLFLLGLVVAGGSLSAAGEAQSAPDPVQRQPSFHIERIVVEGTRQVPAAVLVAETRLEEGKTYSEGELRSAVDRIRRLPFVVGAELALRKGSERGRYELHVSVQETRRFFFFTELATLGGDSQLFSGDNYAVEGNILTGFRHWLTPRLGLFLAASVPDGLQAGITRYDLFGSGAFLSLAFARNQCCTGTLFPLGEDLFEPLTEPDTEEIQLLYGMPLGQHQSMFLTLREMRDTTDLFDSYRQRTAGLVWQWDSSDDPIFPTRGMRFSAKVEDISVRSEVRFEPIFPGATSFGNRRRTDATSLTASATRHWPWGRGHAVSLSATLGTARVRSFQEEFLVAGDLVTRSDAWEDRLGVGARLSFDLLRGPARREWGELRFEVEGVARWRGRAEDALHLQLDQSQTRVQASLALRNGWGLFRLAFLYDFAERGGSSFDLLGLGP